MRGSAFIGVAAGDVVGIGVAARERRRESCAGVGVLVELCVILGLDGRATSF